MTVVALHNHPFGDTYAGLLPAADPRLHSLRTAARAALAHGLPGAKVEAWRFTPLTTLARINFMPATAADDIDVTSVPLDVPAIADAVRVVLVNGVFRADLSDQMLGLDIRSLNDSDAAVGAITGVTAPMVALNTAYFRDGIAFAADRVLTRPIHIVSIGAAGASPVAFHPRVLITTSPGASVTVVETHVGLPGQPFLSNPVTEISVAEDAIVRRYVSVREDGDAFHFATTAVTVAARGRFEAFHLGLAGAHAEGTVRQEIHVAAAGEGAAINLSGAYAQAGTAHHDFTTVIEHTVPGATSRQVFKGVLAGRAHGVYQGRITVASAAQKTDARQLHKALFLEAGPQVDCKPELEIAADDVQCAHGATTGAIDPDHLFYLAARGLDPESARALLVEGFLADALEEISDADVRAVFARQTSTWLQRRGGVS